LRQIETLPCERCGGAKLPEHPWTYGKWDVPPGRVLVVARPGISEAHVRMGFLGPKRQIPEFYDLRVAETGLSGHFASRLNDVIREKLNLTYNISAGFYFGRNTGTFNVATSTRNEKIGDLLKETNRQLGDFARDGLSEEEVKMAKDYILGSFPIGLQNLYTISNAFFGGVLMGLDPGFMDAFTGRIEKVTAESVRAAVKKHFHLEHLRTVVVGDPAQITPRLEKANIPYIVRQPADFL
jgi:zinc protease